MFLEQRGGRETTDSERRGERSIVLQKALRLGTRPHRLSGVSPRPPQPRVAWGRSFKTGRPQVPRAVKELGAEASEIPAVCADFLGCLALPWSALPPSVVRETQVSFVFTDLWSSFCEWFRRTMQAPV